MRGARFWLAVGFGLFVFLGLSVLLARGLTGSGNERARVLELLRAQASGDASAVLRELPACASEPACVRLTRDRVAGMRRPGPVEILQYRPSVRVALTRRTGTGRVAWRAGASSPVVQCVRVVREGPLSGGGLELLSISGPVGGEASC
jgi:hypothetical protein